MLLRSSSAPILNSWLLHHQCYVSSRETSLPEAQSHLHKRTNSVSMCSSSNSIDHITRKLVHKDKTSSSVPRREARSSGRESEEARAEKTSTFSAERERLLSNSGLGEKVEQDSDGGGGMGGDDGGNICGGDGGGEFSDSEAYYMRMIEMNPGNSLFLGNYAKFLKEVKGEMRKAEEYCERAILANPNDDGNILSLYADLIWHSHNDLLRAHTYFLHAVKSSPHDCYVQASYARFLWEVEEDEENIHEEEEEEERGAHEMGPFRPQLFHDPPITAPS